MLAAGTQTETCFPFPVSCTCKGCNPTEIITMPGLVAALLLRAAGDLSTEVTGY